MKSYYGVGCPTGCDYVSICRRASSCKEKSWVMGCSDIDYALGTTPNITRAKPCATCRSGDVSECDDCLHRDTLVDNYNPRTASPVV